MNYKLLLQYKIIKRTISLLILGVFFSINLIICSTAQANFSLTNSMIFGGKFFNVQELKNGQYAFVSITNKSHKNKNGKFQQSGLVAVLKRGSSGWQVQRYIIVNSSSINNTGKTGVAYGMALSPNESILAVAMDKKVALIDVKAALQGDTVPQYVSLDTGYYSQTGAIAVVAASDNKHFFIADEYGQFNGKAGTGDVAIISASITGFGAVKGQRLGYIKTGQNSIASLNISPDGKTLYIPNQVAIKEVSAKFNGSNNPALSKQCVGSNYNGSISIVDVDKAISLANKNIGNGNRVIDGTILANVAAGCNPVRVAPSRDGKTVWVTARGSANIRENMIHAYDAELLRKSPENAHLYSIKSNGESPIGIAAFGNDRYIAVSNSNRFNVQNINGKIVPSNISIFDVSNRKNPKLVTSFAGGLFPRDITASYDSNSVHVAIWDEGSFKTITKDLN